MTVINPDLINDLAERRTVIFVGAGVSAGVTTRNGGRLKVWDAFLKENAEKLTDRAIKKQALDLIKNADYLMACEMISRGLGDKAWELALTTEYNQRAQPSPLQKLIMQLKQRIILTTNFDLFLEKAWDEVNSDSTHNPRILKRLDSNALHAFRDSDEYIIKIHGSIDDLDSMIFTKKEYSDKAYGNWAYSKFIETILLTHTVIFVGFSLADPAISQIIENYAHHLPQARPHYIFLAGNQSETFVQINKDLRRIFIVPYKKTSDHGELTKLFERIVSEVDTRRREMSLAALRSKDE
ncbi:SIR2 family protein [Pseudomonas sp. PS01298]|uniref:SIR2 family protein n=1 Tax=Pseudomonas sp. PS01298 TaxID=2991434 RepID=UPI00249CB1D5|nr:SIR2 family protein [Pseudomonas sp. PS01298]